MICVALGAALRNGMATCELAAAQAGQSPWTGSPTPGCPRRPREGRAQEGDHPAVGCTGRDGWESKGPESLPWRAPQCETLVFLKL